MSWLKHVRFCLHKSLKQLSCFYLNEKVQYINIPNIQTSEMRGSVNCRSFPSFFSVDLAHVGPSSAGINTEVKYVHVVLFSAFHRSPWKEISVVKAQE